MRDPRLKVTTDRFFEASSLDNSLGSGHAEFVDKRENSHGWDAAAAQSDQNIIVNHPNHARNLP